MGHWGNDELRDALLWHYSDWILTQIDQNDLDLAPIVCVDCARRVHHREALFDGAAAASAYLSFEAGGYFERYSSGYSSTA
jgi:hypothetical protein